MSFGLRQKLLFGIVGVVALMSAAMYVLTQTTVRSILEERLASRAVSVGHYLARESEGPILTGEHFRLRLAARERGRGARL